MSDLKALSKEEIARRYESMKNSFRRLREDGKQVAKTFKLGLLTSAGGAASGYLSTNSSLVKVPGTDMPMDASLGTALLVGCSFDMFDSMNDDVAAFASGLLAAAAARETQKIVLSRLGTR